METLLLWSEAELPVSPPVEKPTWQQQVERLTRKAMAEARKAEQELREKFQLNFNHLLRSPILRSPSKRKTVSRKMATDCSGIIAAELDIPEVKRDWPVVFSDEWVKNHKSELKEWFQDNSVDAPRVLTDAWIRSRIVDVHCWVLDESINALGAAENDDEKMDILEWIFSPSYIEKLGKTPDGHPYVMRRHVTDIPFSFVNCCRAAGQADPDDFRELLVERMSEEFRPKLEKYLQMKRGITH